MKNTSLRSVALVAALCFLAVGYGKRQIAVDVFSDHLARWYC